MEEKRLKGLKKKKGKETMLQSKSYHAKLKNEDLKRDHTPRKWCPHDIDDFYGYGGGGDFSCVSVVITSTKDKVISRAMSSPSIVTNEERDTVSGTGLALVDVVIERDAAYWEWHIEAAPPKPNKTNEDFEENGDKNGDGDEEFFAEQDDETMHDLVIKFGVATKKPNGFTKLSTTTV